MKTKIIPFDLETAKKIQAGEIEGAIKTRTGDPVRLLCTDIKNSQCIAAAKLFPDGSEIVLNYDPAGNFNQDCSRSNHDLVLEVHGTEPEFRPFDRVLVRDSDNEEWICAIFSHTRYIQSRLYVRSTNGYNLQCIPYEGNQELVGTTDKPKEE